MSPASYLTAPPRDATSMVAPARAAVSIVRMVGLWLSLAVLLVAVAGGLAFAAVRGFQLYRKVKRTGSAFSSRTEAISRTVALDRAAAGGSRRERQEARRGEPEAAAGPGAARRPARSPARGASAGSPGVLVRARDLTVAEGAIPAAARESVARYPLCFVASLNEDGSPNLSPKGTVRVWDADQLVFADVASPQTVANVEPRRPRARQRRRPLRAPRLALRRTRPRDGRP